MVWGHLILGLHSWWLGQRGVDAQGLGGGTREPWRRRGEGQALPGCCLHLPLARDGVPPTTRTCATMLVTSPALAGSRRVLESLASLEKALTYCSATEREAAALPCWGERDEAQQQVVYHQQLTRTPVPSPPWLVTAPKTAKLLTRCC